MSKEHITYRVIDGIRYHCKDAGCDDFDRAEYNRYIGEHNLFTTAYVLVEQAVARTPLNQPLASWIPRGEPPQVSKKVWQRLGGGQRSGYEIIEPKVVGA